MSESYGKIALLTCGHRYHPPVASEMGWGRCAQRAFSHRKQIADRLTEPPLKAAGLKSCLVSVRKPTKAVQQSLVSPCAKNVPTVQGYKAPRRVSYKTREADTWLGLGAAVISDWAATLQSYMRHCFLSLTILHQNNDYFASLVV